MPLHPRTSISLRPFYATAWRRVSALLIAIAGTACDRTPAPGEPTAAEISSPDREYFETHVRPLLAEHCYECHSESAGKQKGGLWLDRKAGWTQGGDSGPALIIGKPDESLLVSAIHRSKDQVDAMPPDYRLTDREIETLEQWIARGAPDPRLDAPAKPKSEGIDVAARKAEQWCWQPLPPAGTLPPLPPVSDKNWLRQPVDAFLLAALDEKGLRPAVEVSPQAWLRRVSFDLTGLPPSVEELATFLADGADEPAYARAVDRLLASHAFGENWARHWMDLVRYAESYGHEFDFAIPHAHEYRDYLIRAFNTDLPYDQLLREHLAGDLLKKPRLDPENGCNESILGTGFWFFHEEAHAPTDPRGDEADHMANQIDVFGKTFLSLTLGCARCHDHKFDAITTKDYYALSAYLRSSPRQIAALDPHGHIAAATSQLEALRGQLDDALKQSAASLPASTAGEKLRRIGDEILKAREPFVGKNPWPDDTALQLASPGEAPRQWQAEQSSSDALVSKPFIIERPFLNFLMEVRNASPEKIARIELLVGDHDSAALVTRISDNQYSTLQTWDLREHIGKTVRIRLRASNIAATLHQSNDAAGLVVAPTRDTSASREVRLAFSHATQADAPCSIPATTPSPHADLFHRLASVPPPPPAIDPFTGEAAVAEKLGSITGDLSDCESVEAFFATLLASPERIESIRQRQRDYRMAEQEFYQKSKPLHDFAGDQLPEYWNRSGAAFVLSGSHCTASLAADQLLAPAGIVDSSLLGAAAEGRLRTPIFEIPTNNIHLHLRAGGPGTRARLIIDDYQLSLDFGLLFEGTYLKTDKLDTAGASVWKSFTTDLHKYVGHRACIEFVDEGSGQIAIDEIRFANRLAPFGHVHPVIGALVDAMPDKVDLHLAADALDQLCKDATQHLGSAQLQAIDVEVLNWLESCHWLDDRHFGKTITELRRRAAEIDHALPRPRYALTMAAAAPEPARVNIRGSHDNLGETVPARDLEALGGRSGDRLQLAEDLTALDNPLTARVIANRLWHHLFGRGLVASVDDFGPMGTEPSHPDLLDWLARDLADHDWSIKRSLRQIVLSSTYRQSTQPHPDLDKSLADSADPDNALLHHYPRRRLSAEVIHDSLLAVSGDLIRDDTGGASVPVHLTAFMTNREIDHNGPLDGNRRRSIYGQVKRNYLSPFLLSFDFPRPLGTMGARRLSNVPAQALTLLNDPFVHQQAERWASRELAENAQATDRERLQKMFRSALGRPPESAEQTRLLEFLKAPDSTPQQRWTELAHALFNLKEFIYLD